MIINADVHPRKNLYYIGAMILTALSKSKSKEYEIEALLKKLNNKSVIKISYDYLLLSLDWLYLANVVEVQKNGKIKLCI